jgi:hypothetical protein
MATKIIHRDEVNNMCGEVGGSRKELKRSKPLTFLVRAKLLRNPI